MSAACTCPRYAAGEADFVINEAGGIREYESYYHVNLVTLEYDPDKDECPDHWLHQIDRLEKDIAYLHEQLKRMREQS